MKRKIVVLTSFIVLLIATLAFFASAQSQRKPSNEQDSIKALETRVQGLEARLAALEAQVASLKNPTTRVQPLK